MLDTDRPTWVIPVSTVASLRERILELTGDELLMREESLRNVSSGKGKGEAAHY